MAVFTVIDHEEFTGATSYWEHTGIPTTYDHLLLMVSGRSDSAGVGRYGTLQFGDGSVDTGSNYSTTSLMARTATPVSERNAEAFIRCFYANDDNDTADTFSIIKAWIPNYANTANFKPAIIQAAAENASTSDNTWGLGLNAGLWSSTDNIERIRLSLSAGDWMQYSTFTLYGVTGA